MWRHWWFICTDRPSKNHIERPLLFEALYIVQGLRGEKTAIARSALPCATGRALASQLLSFLGLVMLGVMCVAVDLRLLLFAHLMRGGMQNAIYPIDRSLIVDFTKSQPPDTLNPRP